MGPARIYPWRKMRRSRAPSIAPGAFFVAQSWADCITNMAGFNLRQAQENDTTLFIARAEAEHIVSTGVRIGAHLPAYCSATGRVLLSQFAGKDILERIGRKALPARTPRTLTKPTDIVAEICSVREKGYAISDEELELGIRALAVPVAGSNGEIVAAVSVSASSARVRAVELSKRFLPILQSCARMLVEAT
jgi:IclR family pca regulon transcriptional regulator